MRHHIRTSLALALVGIASAGSIALASLARSASTPVTAVAAEEMEIKLTDMPEAARAVVLKSTTANSVKKITRETAHGVTTYEIDYVDGSVPCAMLLSATGDVIESERGIEQDKIPAAALAALKQRYPDATMGDAVVATKVVYEIEITVNGKKQEVKVEASGAMEDKKGGWKEGGDKSEAKEKSKGKAKDDDADEDDDEGDEHAANKN